ncbi:MAG: 3-deoxy-8-phosphooctulonate synthase [Planctomycetota bacterium]
MTANDRLGRTLTVGAKELGGERPFLFAGPCVLEREDLTLRIASRLAEIAAERGVDLVFKASFDKANRTKSTSQRGPGIAEGLAQLARVRDELGLPTLTDVHLPEQCAIAAEAVDVLQIPAFLCRQTDLLLAAGETGRAVNVKKGQFLAPWDMAHAVEKVRDGGGRSVSVCERGSTFGYGRLVVDMAGLDDMAAFGVPVVFDATHSVQRPGTASGTTGGDRRLAPLLARAAAATGRVDGFFFEVHEDPDSSPSDAANMLRLDAFPSILDGVLAAWDAGRGR